MRLRALVVMGLSCVLAPPAFGAGYGLKEHSADAMAAAYAGSAATSSDASYLAYNPASLAGVADTDLSVSMAGLIPATAGTYSAATTSAGTPTGGSLKARDIISAAAVPAFGLRHRLSDRIVVGLEISAPWGFRTNYAPSWAGRYYALKTELLTINATPSVSYQLTPGLVLGAGLQIEFAQAGLTSAIDTGTLGALNGIPGALPGKQDSFARLSGKNWTFGYTAGVMATPFEGVTLGLAYHSSLQHDLKGPLTFTLDSAGIGAAIRAATGALTDTTQTTGALMPDMLEFGARADFSQRWSGMLEIDGTHWSRFHGLVVDAANPLQPDDVTTMHWRDTLFGSIGVEYRASDTLALRAGAAYDQSPLTDITREPRMPDADRMWLSLGVRFRLTDHFDFNATAARLSDLTTKTNLTPAIPGAALRGSLTGSTESFVDVAGLQLTYRP